jgi:ABC-type Mn2+/Zn2+ transport system ATPase subunit
MSILSAENLRYGPPGGSLFPHRVNFQLKRGQTLVVAGSNGAGKTVLLQVLLGLKPASEGLVKRSFLTCCFLPQTQTSQFHLPFCLGDVATACGTQEASSSILPKERWTRQWNRASGGERQRALLARILAPPSDLLVLDEPFNHLDGPGVTLLKDLLKDRMSSSNAPALLIVAHGSHPEKWLPGQTQVLALDGEHCHEVDHG